LSSVTALNTAVSWSHVAGDGVYNVAYDVWLGDGNAAMRGLQSYFMVWLKDPAGEGPAGSLIEEGITIPNAPGVWNIVAGEVNNLPIVNYVRAEGDELPAMAFNIMDFINDAKTRNLEFPGDDVLAVAIGFEIWTGPVTGLKLNDFCLDIQ
jgi:Glycosyl hydrolase family 12